MRALGVRFSGLVMTHLVHFKEHELQLVAVQLRRQRGARPGAKRVKPVDLRKGKTEWRVRRGNARQRRQGKRDPPHTMSSAQSSFSPRRRLVKRIESYSC